MRRLTCMAWGVVLLTSLTIQGAEPTRPRLPSWSSIETEIGACFEGALRERKPPDLLTQGDVSVVLGRIERLGWIPCDREAILAEFLPDQAPLVKQLRTPAGTSFMRHVGAQPQGYQRLEHLARLSDGHQLVDRLIQGPDGHKLIDYLAATSGGREMGKMLSSAPGGKNFNGPTGHRYTRADLVERLERSHEADRKGTAAPRSPSQKNASPAPGKRS